MHTPRILTFGCLAGLALFAAPAGDPPPLRGYSPESAAQQREWETKFRALPNASEIGGYVKRLSARPHHVGSPYDKDNAEWILGKFKEWGSRTRRSKRSTCCSPRPKSALLELVGAHALHGETAGARRRRSDPDLEPARRAASHLQRLLHRRRRHRAAGLRELRRARGLRAARTAGRFGQGRDRDRALRRLVARHQAEGGGRARRGRLHHLFRSARRRLLHGRGVSRRAHGAIATACSAAASWICRSIPAIPLTPGDRRHGRRKAPGAERGADAHENSGAADFLRRCAAAAGGAGRPRGAGELARRAADHLSRRTGAGEGPPQGEFNWDIKPHLQRDRAEFRARRIRTSGSCAAIITTPG